VMIQDEDGCIVTDLVSNRWSKKEFCGTMTIKPTSAEVTVKGDVSKTYGDPDPDSSTWVAINTSAGIAKSDALKKLVIERVSGEDVGRYEIRVDCLQAIGPIGPIGKKSIEDEAVAEKKRAVVGPSYPDPERATDVNRMPNVNVKVVDDGKKFFTINKAKLTITANDNSKDFGTEDPTLTATVSKGLVGSEALPKDFYSIYRDKGEDVKALPDYYTIHVDAPNEDVDWLEETHYFADSVEEPIIDKPIEVSKEEASAKEHYVEEAMAKEDVVYSAKAAKASKEYNPPKEEISHEAVEVAKEEIDAPPAAEAEAGVPADEIAPVKPERPYIASSTEFKLKNYEVVTKNGKFNIVGKTAGDTSGNNSTSGATGGSSGGSDNGDDSSKTGDGFGLLETLALLTASLVGMLALVAIRRREQE
ncbi:MAG: MBG domain-containing protein, partial [Bacillota bacterium]